jgi:hypothetical protein
VCVCVCVLVKEWVLSERGGEKEAMNIPGYRTAALRTHCQQHRQRPVSIK